MAYFKQNSRQKWSVPNRDNFDDEYFDDEEYDDDDLTDEELSDLRRYRFRMAAGLFDFLAVVAGTVVILLLVALLVNLVTWLQGDLDQMFTLLQRNL